MTLEYHYWQSLHSQYNTSIRIYDCRSIIRLVTPIKSQLHFPISISGFIYFHCIPKSKSIDSVLGIRTHGLQNGKRRLIFKKSQPLLIFSVFLNIRTILQQIIVKYVPSRALGIEHTTSRTCMYSHYPRTRAPTHLLIYLL